MFLKVKMNLAHIYLWIKAIYSVYWDPSIYKSGGTGGGRKSTSWAVLGPTYFVSAQVRKSARVQVEVLQIYLPCLYLSNSLERNH